MIVAAMFCGCGKEDEQTVQDNSECESSEEQKLNKDVVSDKDNPDILYDLPGEGGGTVDGRFNQDYYYVKGIAGRAFSDQGKVVIFFTLNKDFSVFRDIAIEDIAKQIGDSCCKIDFPPYLHMALYDTLSSISITCDRDYDAFHAKDSNLADIAALYCTSPMPYIQSGCTKESERLKDGFIENTRDYFDIYNPFYAVVKNPADNINPASTGYITDRLMLVLDKQPDTDEEITMKISAKFSNNEYSFECKYKK